MKIGTETTKMEKLIELQTFSEKLWNFLKEHEKDMTQEQIKKYGTELTIQKHTIEQEIIFEKFKKENKLKFNKRTGKWNKEYLPIIKTTWIKDKKNWNNHLKKYGYYQNYVTGYRIQNDESMLKCKWCGKLLTGRQINFCSDESHKKLFSRVIGIGKKLYDFDFKKGHILLKPTLWNYTTDENGALVKEKTDIERIERKDIVFYIDGKRISLTKKKRTMPSDTNVKN